MSTLTSSSERFFGKVFFLSLIFIGIVLGAIAQPCACGNGRYTSPVFGRISLGVNVQYTQNAGENFDGTLEHEAMDVWGPQGDNCTQRPLIIWVHGGGFAQMDKTAPDVVAMCDSFSRRGFVVASIDYRDDYWGVFGPVNDFAMNPTPYDNKEFTRAGYRAMQDAKCAVRFFKANAAQYGIDTNLVFMGGTSAGAWTSLLVAYVNQNSEKASEAFAQSLVAGMYARPDLGGIEGAGGWSNHTSKVRGIISCWGALPDTAWIDGPNDPAAILFHEYGDPVVDYYYGPPFSGQYGNFPSYWGTYYNSMQMQNVNVDHRTFPIVGNQHALYPYRTMVTNEVSAFLDSIICTPTVITSAATEQAQENSLRVFPNPSSGEVSVTYFAEQNENVRLEIFDAQGKLVHALSLGEQSGEQQLRFDAKAEGLIPGMYLLRLSCGEMIRAKRLAITD